MTKDELLYAIAKQAATMHTILSDYGPIRISTLPMDAQSRIINNVVQELTREYHARFSTEETT